MGDSVCSVTGKSFDYYMWYQSSRRYLYEMILLSIWTMNSRYYEYWPGRGDTILGFAASKEVSIWSLIFFFFNSTDDIYTISHPWKFLCVVQFVLLKSSCSLHFSLCRWHGKLAFPTMKVLNRLFWRIQFVCIPFVVHWSLTLIL